MKRTEQCPRCDGTGRDAELIAKHPEHTNPDGTVVPAYEGPAQCALCSGTGKIGKGYVDRTIKVPHDHPKAKEIERLLKGDQ